MTILVTSIYLLREDGEPLFNPTSAASVPLRLQLQVTGSGTEATLLLR